jgi:glycerol-3-phosphate dehydrogenase (NAD+)
VILLIVAVEREMLNGQSCQGKGTADEVHDMLVARGCQDKFPLFVAIHEIISSGRDPKSLLRDI